MHTHPALTDAELVALARAGHHGAFDTLVIRHSGRIYAVAMRMMRNRTDAEDIVQETFMNAFRRLDSFREEAALTSWLHRIATNCCLMRMRSRRRRPEVPLVTTSTDGEEWARPIPDPSVGIDVDFENRELGQAIASAIQRLPENYRAVLLLADVELQTMKQIAEALKLTVPNVKTRLHRARLRMRASLADYLAAAPVVIAA